MTYINLFYRLAFRQLVRKYECDLVFTPMIVSSCFIESQNARDANLITCDTDRPLVVQFAANKAEEFAQASEMVEPYVCLVHINKHTSSYLIELFTCQSNVYSAVFLIYSFLSISGTVME